MVKPVVVIVNVVWPRLARHTAKRGLATVKIVVVSNGDILRVAFHVGGAVTFHLIGIAAFLSIEQVEVVHPDVFIIRIE